MRLFARIGQKRFTIFAVSGGSDLAGLSDRAELKKEIEQRLQRYLPGTSLAASFYMNIGKTVIVWPDEWDSPTDFSDPKSVLSGDSWDKICTHLAKDYGKLQYNIRKNKTVHFITPDHELAVFQFSAK